MLYSLISSSYTHVLVMAYILMAYIVMAYIVTGTYIVMAYMRLDVATISFPLPTHICGRQQISILLSSAAHMSAHMFAHMPIHMSRHLSVHISIPMSAHMSALMPIHMLPHISIHIYTPMPAHMPMHPSACRSVNRHNECCTHASDMVVDMSCAYIWL